MVDSLAKLTLLLKSKNRPTQVRRPTWLAAADRIRATPSSVQKASSSSSSWSLTGAVCCRRSAMRPGKQTDRCATRPTRHVTGSSRCNAVGCYHGSASALCSTCVLPGTCSLSTGTNIYEQEDSS